MKRFLISLVTITLMLPIFVSSVTDNADASYRKVVPTSLRGSYYHYVKKSKRFHLVKFTKHSYFRTGFKHPLWSIPGKQNRPWGFGNRHTLVLQYNTGYWVTALTQTDAAVAAYKPMRVKVRGKFMHVLKEKWRAYPGAPIHYRYWYPSKIK